MGGVGANKARLGRERARSEGRRRAAERSAVKLLRAAARSRILVATDHTAFANNLSFKIH